jgi:hypothetical protein
MTRKQKRVKAARNPWTADQESRPCAKCGAQPGQQCVTRDGHAVNMPHMSRFYAAERAKTGRTVLRWPAEKTQP